MTKEFSSYILSFLIIFSNILTVIFCYPIFLEFVIIYSEEDTVLNMEVAIYFSLLIFSYEIAKILGNYFWSFISFKYGNTICSNLSLFALTSLNFSLSFSSSYTSALLIRMLTGFFNCMGILSKTYILELFSSEHQLKVVYYITNFANLSTIFGFLIGGLIYTQPIELNQRALWGMNKFFINCWFVSSINLLTLIFNLIKSNFKITVNSRRIQIRENNDLTYNNTNPSKDHERRNSLKFKKNKSSLASFENSNQSMNNSSSKKEIEKISDHVIEKEISVPYLKENKEEKNCNLSGNDLSNNDYEKKDIIKTNSQMINSNQNNIDLNSENNTHYSKIEYNSSTKYSHSQKNQKDVIDIFKYETNNYQNNDDSLNKIQSNHLGMKDNHNNQALKDDKLYYNKIHLFPIQIKEQDSYSEKDKTVIISSKSVSTKFLFDFKNEKNLFVCSFNINVLKLNSIFTFIQVSEIIIYNFFLLLLFTDTNHHGFALSITNIALLLSCLHILYSLSIHFINNKLFDLSYSNRGAINFFLQFSIIVSALISILFPLNIILFKEISSNSNIYKNEGQLFRSINYNNDIKIEISTNFLRLLISCCLFLLRNICLSVSMICYNILVSRIDNNSLKEKVNFYNSYISHLCKSIFGFISCLSYYLIIYKLQESYYFLLLSVTSGGFLVFSFILSKGFTDIFLN